MAGPSSTGNYAASAIAAARDNERILQGTLQNSPDYSKIVQEAAIRRSKENIAALRAETKVQMAGVQQFGATAEKKALIDAKEDLRSAKRKAGVLASAGSLLGTGLAGLAPSDRKKREVGAEDDYFQTQIDKKKAEADKFRTEAEGLTTEPSSSSNNAGSTPETSKDTGSSGVTDDGRGKTVSADISAQHAAGPGKLSKTQIKDYAIQAGFSPEQASTVVGIAGGESGFDPTNSTKRSGLYAKTGEDSVGLMQINWGYHKDSGWLQDLGITKREQLLDPATNMKAAKYLHDGRGNFGDWTVYNKGIYKDYL